MTKYLLIATLAFGTVACTRESSEMRRETEGTRARTETAADNWEKERLEYRRSMEDRLNRIDREMDEERLAAEKRRMDAKARQEYNERMEELRNLRQETKEQWNKLEAATKEGWNDFKRGMDNAADRFDRAWERFKADMRT